MRYNITAIPKSQNPSDERCLYSSIRKCLFDAD